MVRKLMAIGGGILLGTSVGAVAATPGPFLDIFSTASFRMAAQDGPMPQSRDALFDLEPVVEKKTEGVCGGKAPDASPSKDALFDLSPDKGEQAIPQTSMPASKGALFADAEPKPAEPRLSAANWHGFFQTELARTYANPDHWSKFVGRLELGNRGKLENGVQWNISGRLDYNAVYDITNFYPSSVREDQRLEFMLRENYLDFAAGGWDWRLGRQHIVWGEMVGLFFADVVSAKDMREFVLQDFQLMRIPQWAARAEYFKDDFHAELVWVPFPSYDEVGEPGAEYFAYPASAGIPVVLGTSRPARRLSNTNYGLRLSRLIKGWDLAGFYYSSMDSSPAYYLAPAVCATCYQGHHERIHQAGGTLAKDMGNFVLKGEAVYTRGRAYNVVDAADADGVAKQNTLDWVVGLDFNPGMDSRLNTQFFQRVYFGHDARIIPDRVENGFSLLASYKLRENLEAEALLVRSLNRNDWMFRPKLNWGFERNWRLLLGLDIFGGPPDGLFGQFDDTDRVYAEVRHDF